jgi:tryptophanyl-tRNA synthetase
MSKSDPNPKSRILITDTKQDISKKIKAAVTDSIDGVTYDPNSRPELANLINMAYFLGDGKFTPEEFVADCQLKSSFKEKLANLIDQHIAPIRERYLDIMDDASGKELDEAAFHGAEKARSSAEETMEHVRRVIGFR